MATLGELLENFGLSEDAAGEEKTAAEKTVDSEQELINLLENEGQTKTAGETEMTTLADLYLQMTSQDEQFAKTASHEEDVLEKIAEAEALEELENIKLAQEYDVAGRFIARGFWDEFDKLARELEEASEAQTPALGDRGTQYQMETNYEDKGKIETKGGEQQHANILKGKADGPAGRAESAMGPQFATAQTLLTNRASQANAQ
jgi:hypothetical protein